MKNAEIVRLYEQLKAKDEQLAKKDEQLRVKDVQIAEKDKQLDQQQQLTLQAMNDRDTLKLELEQANEKFKSKKARFLGTRFPSIIRGWILPVPFLFYHRRFPMKALEDYIAFDLEFNQYEGAYQIIQVSAVRFTNGKEVDHYDSYVYTDKPLKAFY